MRGLRALSSVRCFAFPGLWVHLRDMANSIYAPYVLGVDAPYIVPSLPLFHGISQPNPWVEVIPP